MILIKEYNIIALMHELGENEETLKSTIDSIYTIFKNTGEVGEIKLSWYLSKLESYNDIRPLQWFVDIVNKCANRVLRGSQIDLIYYASFSIVNMIGSGKATGNYLKKVFSKVNTVEELLDSKDEDFGVYHIARTRVLKDHIIEYK